jgi:N-formylglutamate deformylase
MLEPVEATFRSQSGPGPVIATAIHDGHALWPEVLEHMALAEDTRRREEDPYTARWTSIAATRVIATHSRFQCDFNRERARSVYQTPEEAWGLRVWKAPPPAALLERLWAEHDAFYARLRELCEAKQREYGRFLVLDLHSYNRRREGVDGSVADPKLNPDVNIGTGSMPAGRWDAVVQTFLRTLSEHSVLGQRLDARQNVRFRGGYLSQWVHERYPRDGCALAIEVKKIFMDEWTGVANEPAIAQIEHALDGAVAFALKEL